MPARANSNELPKGWRDEGKERPASNGKRNRFDHLFVGPKGERIKSKKRLLQYLGMPGAEVGPSNSPPTGASMTQKGPTPTLSIPPLSVDVNLIASKEPVMFRLSRAGGTLPSVTTPGKPDQLVFTLQEEAGEAIDNLLVELLTRVGKSCPSLVVSVHLSPNCSTQKVLPPGVVVMPTKVGGEESKLAMQGTTSKGESVHGYLILKPTMKTTNLSWVIKLKRDVTKVGTPVMECCELLVTDEYNNQRKPTGSELASVNWTIVRNDDPLEDLNDEADSEDDGCIVDGDNLFVGRTGRYKCSVAQAEQDATTWRDGWGRSSNVTLTLLNLNHTPNPASI